MYRLKVNFLALEERIRKRRQKERLFFTGKLVVFPVVILFLMGSLFSAGVLFSSESVANTFRRLPIISQIQRLVYSKESESLGEEDRINVLLLGMGGVTHDAGMLTDTIIFVSIKSNTSQVSMVSIPRDLMVPIPQHGWGKINSINAFAESEFPGSGAEETAKVVGALFKQPIHYYVRMDFDGFEKIIDDLGGVSVCVERSFDDYSYPVRGREADSNYQARFEHLAFQAGCQEMDGTLALKYSRSRHAAGYEGSDFARARRQQLLLQAIKDKALSLSTLVNPKKIGSIYADLKDHISTNIEIWEVLRFASLAKDFSNENVTRKVFDNSHEGMLISSIAESGAYILSPQGGDFSSLQNYFANIFNAPSGLVKESPEIEVQNGTTIEGLAKIFTEKMERWGYEVNAISNADQTDYDKTVIYDLTGGTSSEVLGDLKTKLNANVSAILPSWIKKSQSALGIPEEEQTLPSPRREKTDILIILGREASSFL